MQELGEDMSAAMSLGATRASNFLRSSLSTLKLSSLTASKKQESVVEEADTGINHILTPPYEGLVGAAFQ